MYTYMNIYVICHITHLEGVFCWQFVRVRALERQKLVHCCGNRDMYKYMCTYMYTYCIYI